MGKIIDRVRARQENLEKIRQRERAERISDYFRSEQAARQREENNIYFEQMAAQQNAYPWYNNASQLQNSKEAKRWNAQSIEQPQHPAPAHWWQFWR